MHHLFFTFRLILQNECRSDDQPTLSIDENSSNKLISSKFHQQKLQNLRIDYENRLELCYNENDILKSLAAELKQQLIAAFMEHETEIEFKITQCSEYEQQIINLTSELDSSKNQISSSHEKYVAELQNEIKALKCIFDENNELLQHQAAELSNKQDTIETMNTQIMNLYSTMEENVNKIVTLEGEILQLNTLLDTNKCNIDELQQINAAHLETIEKLSKFNEEKICEISDLRKFMNTNKNSLEDVIKILRESINKKSNEIIELKSDNTITTDFQEKIIKLDKTVHELESKNREQLEKLKKFAANLKKKNAQCLALEEELSQLQKSDLPLSSSMSDENIKTLKTLLQQKTQEVFDAQKLLDNNVAELNVIKHDMITNEKLQINENNNLKCSNEELLNEIENLHKKLDELILYKQNTTDSIAALNIQLTESQQVITNLKEYIKKTKNSLAAMRDEKQQITDRLTKEIELKSSELGKINDDLQQKNIKFEKCKAVIKEKNREIKRLQDLSNELMEKLSFTTKASSSTIHDFDKLEKNKLELIENEHVKAAANVKLQENNLVIETIKTENLELKNKIYNFDEGISVEEGRMPLKQHSFNLDSESNNKKVEFQNNEDELLPRLNAISTNDELIQQNLRDMEAEKNEMLRKISELELQIIGIQNLLTDLKTDNSSLIEEKKKINDECQTLQISLEKTNAENTNLQHNIFRLKDSVTALEDANTKLKREMTAIKLEYEYIDRNQTEVDHLKYQNNELIQSHESEQSTLRQQIHDLELCVIRNQSECESLNAQHYAINQNNEHELNLLRQQISEFDSLRTQIGQNQTDDQIFLQNENERLITLLEAKEVEIKNYQRQNLKLQMSVQTDVSMGIGPFSELPINNDSNSLILRDRISVLEHQLQIANDNVQRLKNLHESSQNEVELKEKCITKLENRLKTLSNDLEILNLNNTEISNDLLARQITITNLQEFNDNLIEDNKQIKTKMVEIQNEYCLRDAELVKNKNSFSKPDTKDENQLKLEQYISDLQIQLRISTNDCEQFSKTVHSLENEIKTAKNKITTLEKELKKLSEQQMETETKKFNIEPSEIPVKVEISDTKSINVAPFNSAMFFSDTSAKLSLFDDKVDGNNYSNDDVYTGQPVVEDMIVPKKAYLCREDDDQDDECGFGSNDALLEEKHHQHISSMNSATFLAPPYHIRDALKLQEYEEKVNV